MHPILGNRFRLRLYLVAWLFVGLLLAALLRVAGGWPASLALLHALPMALVYGFVCLSAWWVCRAAPLAATPPARILGTLLGAATVASLAWAMLGSVWIHAATGLAERLPGGGGAPVGIPAAALGPRGLTLFFAAGIPSYLLSAVVHYLVVAFLESRAAERRALESQVAARDAELRALRTQLNPHFLFNSLNSINGLVGSDPEAARRMCEGLGAFLRQTLALAGRETVPLGDEIQLVERYLAIEEVRFGARLRSRIGVAAEAAPCPVPPLLLQPLVENAVKHGITNRLEGGVVEIEATLAGDELRVRVTNPCDDDGPETAGEGVGLENVRRRLRALDPRDSWLTAGRRGDLYEVVLCVPLHRQPASTEASR